MKTAIFGLALAFLSTSYALAYQQFTEYRIMGAEIKAVAIGPQEVEDPATLIIDLNPLYGEARQLVLETDHSWDECLQNIKFMIGSKTSYVQIKIQENAQTLNGVVHTECVVLDWEFLTQN